MSVASLGYIVVEATDPGKWASYGADVLGLMKAPGMPDDGNVYLKMDERPFRFAIEKSDRDHFGLAGWEISSKQAYDALLHRLTEAGVQYAPVDSAVLAVRRVQEAVRLQDPSGNSLELYWGADLDYLKFVSPLGIDGFETGFNGDMGLGHVVLPAAQLEATYAFYIDVLGFGDTDRMHFKFSDDPADPGQGLRFLHVDNPRHHSLALFEDANNPVGCVHTMLEVNSVDEVGYCLDRVQQAEIPIVSTLGRHTNDRMMSFYMATPTGFAMEFGCDGLQMDWEGYTPTISALPSIWGHKFAG